MSSQPLVDQPEILVENALIAYFELDPIVAACNPDHWDSDRKYTVPNLYVKCDVGEMLIPGYPVYAFHVNLSLVTKPKQAQFQNAWKRLRTLVESQGVNAALSSIALTIGSNAEDLTTQKENDSLSRKGTITFTLRGFAKI